MPTDYPQDGLPVSTNHVHFSGYERPECGMQHPSVFLKIVELSNVCRTSYCMTVPPYPLELQFASRESQFLTKSKETLNLCNQRAEQSITGSVTGQICYKQMPVFMQNLFARVSVTSTISLLDIGEKNSI